MNGRNRSSHNHNHQPTRGRHYNNHSSTHTSNHCYQQNNPRSLYHGHPSDSYSTNYRHPSTTTTTTTTTDASQAQSQSTSETNCTTTICYSYLIAITSSFLVVLGFYLSITKFNALYLYISLVGFSIVAISACLYCISNIRTSKLSRRKQRVNSDEFILGNGIGASNDLTNLGLDRRQETNTVTHILTNRTLISNDNTNTSNNQNILNSSAIINIDNNNENAQVDRSNDQHLPTRSTNDNPITTIDQMNNQGEPHLNSEETLDSISVRVNNDQQVSSDNPGDDQNNSTTTSLSIVESTSLKVLPNIQSCLNTTICNDLTKNNNNNTNCDSRNKVDAVNGLILQIEQNHPGELITTQTVNDLPSETNNNRTNESGVLDDNNVVKTKNSTNELERSIMLLANERSDASSNNTNSVETNNTTNEISSPTLNETNSDLINLQQETTNLSGEPQVAKRKSKNQHGQRPANLRRTLVMGLSGEEEIIEIDEEDLDNMSILPPSYESIAATQQKQTSD